MDALLENAEITKNHDGGDIAVIGDTVLFRITPTFAGNRILRRNREQIYFNSDEFLLIKSMFQLNNNDSKEYIKEYLSEKLENPLIRSFFLIPA